MQGYISMEELIDIINVYIEKPLCKEGKTNKG
jgi:hypothetical protein